MSQPSPSLCTHWAEHIEGWNRSGLSQRAYCDKHQLAPHQFWYWKRKLNRSPRKVSAAASADNPQAPFVPVTVRQPPRADPAALNLLFPSGIQLTGITQSTLPIALQLTEALT